MPNTRQRLASGDLLKPQCRALTLRSAGAQLVDLEARTCTFPFSSDEPVEMWFGVEILSHEPGAMRSGVRQRALNLLFNHDRDDLLGVVESITLGADRRGHCTVRFGKDERGEWAMNQAADGILINASFMYQVFKYVEDREADTLTAIDWEPYEISLVTIPADASVGLGRSAGEGGQPVEILPRTRASPPGPAAPTTDQPADPAGFFSPESRQQTEGETMPRRRHFPLQEQAPDISGQGAPSGGAPATEPTYDRERARLDGATDERGRITEIDAMCRTHGITENIRNAMITEGRTISEARGIVALELAGRGRQTPLGSLSDDIGLTDKEKRAFSLMRAVNSAVNGDWSGAGFEREVSAAIAKRSGREQGNKGFFFPNDLPFAPTEEHRRAFLATNRRAAQEMAQRAVYQVGATAQGGAMVATNLLADSFIEVLRNQTVTSMLGATYLPGLVGNVDIPRQITATGTYWVGESGAVTESEATFDKVSLRPKTIGALSKLSRLMLLQSTPAIEMVARRDLLSVGALAIDLAALSGSGAGNQPTGITNQAGVNSVLGGTNGANLTFDHLIALKYAIKVANAPQSALGFAMNSKAIGYLSSQKATTGQYLWDPQGGLTAGSPDRVKGSPYAESQQLRSSLTKGASAGICSELIYGNWQELFIGEWGVTEIAVNPYDSAGFANGDVVLRMFQTVDVGVRHGQSFSVMSDALTPGF
jgi:HK97 family phage major capsid protein/HK97 family phage prohead protease